MSREVGVTRWNAVAVNAASRQQTDRIFTKKRMGSSRKTWLAAIGFGRTLSVDYRASHCSGLMAFCLKRNSKYSPGPFMAG